mgnify:CR=1 FL=1
MMANPEGRPVHWWPGTYEYCDCHAWNPDDDDPFASRLCDVTCDQCLKDVREQWPEAWSMPWEVGVPKVSFNSIHDRIKGNVLACGPNADGWGSWAEMYVLAGADLAGKTIKVFIPPSPKLVASVVAGERWSGYARTMRNAAFEFALTGVVELGEG